MQEQSRGSKAAVYVTPEWLRSYREEEGAWHESAEEIERGLVWGREKARLLEWVRRHMGVCLTRSQREYLELYYFRGLSCRQAAALMKTNPSTVHRGLQRALRRLREAVSKDPALLESLGRRTYRAPGVIRRKKSI